MESGDPSLLPVATPSFPRAMVFEEAVRYKKENDLTI